MPIKVMRKGTMQKHLIKLIEATRIEKEKKRRKGEVEREKKSNKT